MDPDTDTTGSDADTGDSDAETAGSRSSEETGEVEAGFEMDVSTAGEAFSSAMQGAHHAAKRKTATAAGKFLILKTDHPSLEVEKAMFQMFAAAHASSTATTDS